MTDEKKIIHIHLWNGFLILTIAYMVVNYYAGWLWLFLLYKTISKDDEA